jgi:hypothetical protein
MDRQELDLLVARADLDGLVRAVDAASAADDWDGLMTLRAACRSAVSTGRQLWPATTLAEYRLALLAPAPWAAAVLTEGAGRFSFGPLSEVAASSHCWAELAPHLEDGPLAAFVAHERVVRGEDLTADERIDRSVLDLPLVLQPWEPRYPLAEYRSSEARFLPPARPSPVDTALPPPAVVVDDGATRAALRDLAGVWLRQSNGRVDAVAVEGDHLGAIAALGAPSARVVEIGSRDALAWMAWAAGDGGAHGRRPGMAHGRFGAWWALAAVAGLLEDWPVPPGDLGEAATELRWFWWDAHELAAGWQVRLAVWDAAEGLAWALTADDET